MFPKQEGKKAQDVLEHRRDPHPDSGDLGMDANEVVEDDYEHYDDGDEPDNPGNKSNQRDRMAQVLPETTIPTRVDVGAGARTGAREDKGADVGGQLETELPDPELPGTPRDQTRKPRRSALGMPSVASVSGNQRPRSGPPRAPAAPGRSRIAQVMAVCVATLSGQVSTAARHLNRHSRTAVPESRERAVDETPLSAEMHRCDRGQVDRLLYLVSLGGDLQHAVGHHLRHVSALTVSDEGCSLKKCLRYLQSTRRYTRRHMDDDIMVGADSDLEELTASMVDTLLLRDMTWLSKIGDKRQFLGPEVTQDFEGFSLAVSASLMDEIIAEAGLDKTTRGTAGPGSASRQGQGRLKHVEVKPLALQDWKKAGLLRSPKVASADKPVGRAHEGPDRADDGDSPAVHGPRKGVSDAEVKTTCTHQEGVIEPLVPVLPHSR